MFIDLLLLVVGFVMLIKGADFFVASASLVAKKFKIPEIIIGLTIVAMGTSLPEASVSINAAINNNSGICFGNVVGSNILNILLILGLSCLIGKIAVKNNTLFIEIPFLIFISLLTLLFSYTKYSIDLFEGIILVILFIIFIIYLIISSKKKSEEESNKKINIYKALILLIIGITLVIFGSDIVVKSASNIAKYFNISDHFIGLTIVALGTSLPELVTSIIAVRRNNTDLAIGNIVGSNIFNVLFILGTSAIISPIITTPKHLIDCLAAILASVVLFIGLLRNKSLSKFMGIIMLILYIIYFLYLCI